MRVSRELVGDSSYLASKMLARTFQSELEKQLISIQVSDNQIFQVHSTKGKCRLLTFMPSSASDTGFSSYETTELTKRLLEEA